MKLDAHWSTRKQLAPVREGACEDRVFEVAIP